MPPENHLLPAFDAWCAHQRQFGRLRRGSSEAVYRAMWHALAAWCALHHPTLRLGGLKAPVLAAYLASRSGNAGPDLSLTPRYQRRLLSLVQRVQAHAADRARAIRGGDATDWTARQSAVPHTPADDRDDGLACLDEGDMHRLQTRLLAAPGPATRWQDTRDRCAAALQLGAGLGPGDLRALRLGDVVAPLRPVPEHPWQLRVPASGSAPAHVAAVAGWAGRLLASWLAERRAQALGGDWLFPSTRSGKPWGKVAQYEAARRVLADAGLDAGRGGSFHLRHSFALRQLRAGHDEADLARWLGVVDPSVMQRYRRALGNGPMAPTLPRFSPPV